MVSNDLTSTGTVKKNRALRGTLANGRDEMATTGMSRAVSTASSLDAVVAMSRITAVGVNDCTAKSVTEAAQRP